jgi:hypothetical protein
MSSEQRFVGYAAGILNRRTLWLFVLMAMGAPTAIAQGQGGGYAQIRGACQADYTAHCTGSTVEPACLRQYWSNLSKKCQAALQQRQSALGGSGEDKQ